MILTRDQSVLVIVDVQEKLAPSILDIEPIIKTIASLAEAAKKLGIPVVLTEHCPDRIGTTVPRLRELVSADAIVSKSYFNSHG